jgi:hypothetical protein
MSWEFQAQTHLLANSAASSTDINYLSPEVLKNILNKNLTFLMCEVIS